MQNDGLRRMTYSNPGDVLRDYEITVSTRIIQSDWDEFLAATEGGHHTQSSAWAGVKTSLGWKPVRIVAIKNGKIAAGAQILIRKTILGQSAGYVPKGPLVPGENPALSRAIIDQIKKVGRRHNCQLIAVQPPSNGYFLADLLKEHGFQKSGLELAPTASIILDLAAGEDGILKNMKQKTRQHIHQCMKAGFEVREGGPADLDAFYDLYLCTAKRQGFLPFHRGYFDVLWERLSPSDWIKLIFISFNGEAVTSQILIPFGDTVISKMIGWSGKYSDLRPNEAIYWASIRWAITRGFRFFDLEGLNPSGVQEVLDGKPCHDKRDIFKYGFGGKPVLFPPAFDFLPNRVAAWVYRRLNIDMESDTLGTKMLEVLRKR